MKKIVLLGLLVIINMTVAAQDFDAVCSTGQTLYYKITSDTPPRKVTLTRPTTGYTQLTGTLEIPSTVTHNENSYTVTAIDAFAFYGCSQLEHVVFPNTIDSILDHSFDECQRLSSLNLPLSLTHIGDYAFHKCTALSDTLVIPDNVTHIGSAAFRKCSGITNVHLSDALLSIEDFTFNECSSLIGPITIPDNVKTIGVEAFYKCSRLSGVTLSQSLTSIKTGAFEQCGSLSGTIIIPDSVVSIDEMAFYSCRQISGIHFGSSLTTIGYCVFGGCNSIVQLDIPNTVSDIGQLAFIDCSNLTRLTLPRNITHIGQSAFCGCPHLTRITCYATNPPTLDGDIFDTITSDMRLYVPCGSTEAYRACNPWNEFSNLIETFNLSIIVRSIDEEMGSVDLTEYPTCESLFATFSATPNRGYRFLHWNDGDTNSERTVAISEDVIYTAYFEANPEEPIGIHDIATGSEPIIIAQKGAITIRDEKAFHARIYDIMGRQLFHSMNQTQTTFSVPQTGIYLVQINNLFTRKIWVLK